MLGRTTSDVVASADSIFAGYSYWSFCQWNARSEKYSAIIYGAGNAFVSTGSAIDFILATSGGASILYFGDINPAGLEFPIEFNRWRAENNRRLVAPAANLYSWLLPHGMRGPLALRAPRNCLRR